MCRSITHNYFFEAILSDCFKNVCIFMNILYIKKRFWKFDLHFNSIWSNFISNFLRIISIIFITMQFFVKKILSFLKKLSIFNENELTTHKKVIKLKKKVIFCFPNCRSMTLEKCFPGLKYTFFLKNNT